MEEFDFGPRRASEFNHRGFWSLFAARHPQERRLRARHGPWFWQRWSPESGLVVSMYVAPQRSLIGVFFGRNEKLGAVESRWKPYQLEIEAALGGLPDDERWSPGSLGRIRRINIFAEQNWPEMADWLIAEAARFERAAIEVLSRGR